MKFVPPDVQTPVRRTLFADRQRELRLIQTGVSLSSIKIPSVEVAAIASGIRRPASSIRHPDIPTSAGEVRYQP